MPDTLIDGNFLQATPVGAKRYEYPFRMNGDRVSALFEEDYWQTKETWTPAEFSVAHPDFPDFYLVAETEPVEFMAGLLRFTRTYSRIPQSQTVPGSMFVTKPLLSGNFPQNIGNSLVTQPNAGVGTYLFYSMTNVSADSGPPYAIIPTGGNYSVTVGPNTTAAIATNATASDVQTSLNGLASVSARNNVGVTGALASGFDVLFNANYPNSTINTANLTGTASTNAASKRDSYGRVVDFGINSSATAFTGGNYTLSVFGQTTSPIAFDATTTQVQSALAALSYVGSNVQVSLPTTGPQFSGKPLLLGNTQILFTAIFGLPNLSVNAANVTPSGSNAIVTAPYERGYRIVLSAAPQGTRVVTAANHNISNSDRLVVATNTGAAYEVSSGNFTVSSSNLITLTENSGTAFATTDAISRVGRLIANYSGGGTAILTRVKKVTDFYLPGVTNGVSNIDTVPLPTFQGSDSAIVSAIIGGSNTINYEVGDLIQWRGTPILQRTLIVLNPSTL